MRPLDNARCVGQRLILQFGSKGMTMLGGNQGGLLSAVLLAAAAVFLAGCSSKTLNPAPVEDRGLRTGGAVTAAKPSLPTSGASASPVDPAGAGASAKVLPGAENAGKPGYYTVKQGDTLIRIALDNGQSWKDVVRWNGIENANVIEAGQVLRVVPPGAVVVAGAAVTKPVSSPGLSSATPLPSAGSTAASASAAGVGSSATGVGPSTSAVSPSTSGAGPSASGSSAASAAKPGLGTAAVASSGTASDDEIAWVWPTAGAVIGGFDEAKNRGIDIDGKAGDSIFASADGTVVFAGAALRGYGNLVILKHNNTYLTAYAHNQTLWVKEDQAVRKGQKIAEMGSSDADRVKLHFEVRRQGKPVDPAKYLPPR